MNFPGILARMLAHQAELAAVLADPQWINLAKRQQLAEAIRANAADFHAFVARYQIAVKKRPCASPDQRCGAPHCEKCRAAERP